MTPAAHEQAAAECRLGLIEYMHDHKAGDPIDLWVAGFWRGVQAAMQPLPATQVVFMLEAVERHLRQQRDMIDEGCNLFGERIPLVSGMEKIG